MNSPYLYTDPPEVGELHNSVTAVLLLTDTIRLVGAEVEPIVVALDENITDEAYPLPSAATSVAADPAVNCGTSDSTVATSLDATPKRTAKLKFLVESPLVVLVIE